MRYLFARLFLIVAMVVFCVPVIDAQQEQQPRTDQLPMEMQIGGTDAESDLPYWGAPDESGRWRGQVLPSGFRGMPNGTTNVFENLEYFAYEYSEIFDQDPGNVEDELGIEGSNFVGAPQMDWPLTEENPDGWEIIEGEEGQNLARRSSDFNDPGNYVLTNAGSRQLSFPLVVASDDDEDEDEVDGEETERGSVRVTAVESLDVVAHDVTPPDVWLGFLEESVAGGSSDFLNRELRRAMRNQSQVAGHIVPALPLVDIYGDPAQGIRPRESTAGLELIQKGSIMAAFEYPHQAPPALKSAAVVTHGPLFEVAKAEQFRSDEDCQVDLTRKVSASLDNEQAIFVRRNVPFWIGAATSDNSFSRHEELPVFDLEETADVLNGGDGFFIDASDRNALERIVRGDDGSFMFRLPNYPREDFADQPDYRLVVRSTDQVGNSLELEVPVYVVQTRAYYEGGRN